jgi:GPH family glycoside/pentoside/hexuronide:cation symporter
MVIVQLGIVLVSTLQIYVFDDFMKLGGVGKSIAHGGTMVGMALGSLTLSFFVKRFGKKGAVRFGVLWAVFCEFLLAALFLTGFLQPEQKFGWFPIASFVFVFFHGAYWFGNGILVPTAISMIADVSEINRIKTTVNKDASYAAMFSLALKVSSSIGAFVAGYCLLWAGFESGADSVQTQESVWRVGALTFIVGPITSLTALALISKYPVTEQLIEDLRTKYNKNKTE